MIYYYSEDNTKFSDKFSAIRYTKQKNQQLFFNYHDEVFSKIDWSLEPPGDINFHYKNQAQRIRDEYDYVVLFYSGGYDSTNILETFYYNNIKIDKIVCVGAFSQDGHRGSDENHNGELYFNSFPYIVQLGLQSITQMCDYAEYFNDIKNFSVYSYGEQWIENVGPWFSPHNWFWKDVHKHVIPKNMENKRVALIWGKDKPNLTIQDNKHGFTFTDVAALSYAGEVKVDNVDRINFYWDPEYPLIVVKQIHELNKLKEYVNPNVLYDLKRPLAYKSAKSPTNILSLRDNFLRTKTNNDVFDFYRMGINKLSSGIDVKNDLVAIKSKFYSIE